MPVFTSTPVTQAVEGSAYTYKLTTTGGVVTYAMTNAPTDATLSGDTISWIPTAAQSRTSNGFTATATTPSGTSASQSWTVTPNGTVRISRVDTLWNESGSTDRPFDWSRISSYVVALVPQPDGSFISLSGTASTNGVFEIPNVPAGYYWLRLGPNDTYWTSTSTFDLGGDYFEANATAPAPANSTTTFNFSFTSLDPTAGNGWLQFSTPEFTPLQYSGSTAAGSTSFTGSMKIGGNVDFSAMRNAFAMQYEPTTFGSVDGYTLGPELTLTNMSLMTGGANTISGSLNPTVLASINLSVEGSAWAPLLDHVSPSAPTAVGGGFYASVQPYIAADGANVAWSAPINLLATLPVTSPAFVLGPTTCFGQSPNLPPALRTDMEAGTVQYSDPFPATWRRTFDVCMEASVDVSVPGTGTTQSIVLANDQTTSLPTEMVKPMISPVQNPRINGADIFTANTIKSTALTLSWEPPTIGTPIGYQVEIMSPTTAPSGLPFYGFLARLSTAKTTMTLPPGLLGSGHTYLFIITSLVDGSANMETSPHRSLLPVAQANLISAPLTIGTVQSN
ncbi:MAG TPA: hypothetical protein VGI45_17625 [Terracidiphilus sp.]